MQIRVDRPTVRDVEKLHRLFDATIRAAFEQNGVSTPYDDELTTEIGLQKERLERDLASGGTDEHFLIARVGDEVVGSAAYGPANYLVRKHLPVDFDLVPEVKTVYVRPDFQGRGVGSLLFGEIVERLRSKGIDEFCLDSGYKLAQRYWERKLGSPKVVLHDHFGPGAHFMIWHVHTDRCGQD
jgi:GNAT superfamily N-acetyltransferase